MDTKNAGQIAALLNTENQLVVPYSAEKILSVSTNYLYETDEIGDVSVFIEVKKVQWYQYEFCHLTVSPNHRREGLGQLILSKAEKFAQDNRGRILQCTIRENNLASQALFQKSGFLNTAVFYYPDSGNNVTVWQKVISQKT